MEKEKQFFRKKGFEVKSTTGVGFYARKEGKNNLFLKFVDFYFIKQLRKLSSENIKAFHEESLLIANAEFKIPKALRLTVPNINSVLLVNEPPSQELIELVSKRNNSFVGGQQDSIFIIDVNSNKRYSPGIELTRITGDAKLVWGNQKEFNKLNGHNRAHHFIEVMMQELYLSD